ncbi:2Fe-2S iron-sulfur cluster-binding protein [Paenarthrobacter nicotinovorans]|uniref:2Fe-2S iron-sulfur cluster-binding protein n=1 Tax=Paenarthrobacter nicotinovorans TaxID=29320 RepID=UPI00047D06F5|nr:2Fe-2S iron-sulfur cluster-binding protein [Paenarthrobacter nicotinovorans]
MSEITFVAACGKETTVEAKDGVSIMKAAVANSVPGIIGECGGQAMCATCHVYVRDEFLEALPPISDDEEEMLEEATAPRDEERSRLGCQLHAGNDFEKIIVEIPGSQI